ncbi:hypothetical protein V8E54_005331 [Elaphomyces granulatus]
MTPVLHPRSSFPSSSRIPTTSILLNNNSSDFSCTTAPVLTATLSLIKEPLANRMTRRKRAITASINNVKRAKQLKEDHTQTVEPEDDGEIGLWNDVLVEESEERREKADNKDEDFLLSPLRGPLPSQTFRPSGTPASSLWRSPSTPERIPPGVGRWTTVTADAVGTYTVKGHVSLCVMPRQRSSLRKKCIP